MDDDSLVLNDDNVLPVINPDIDGLGLDGDLALDPDLLDEDDSVLDENLADWN